MSWYYAAYAFKRTCINCMHVDWHMSWWSAFKLRSLNWIHVDGHMSWCYAFELTCLNCMHVKCRLTHVLVVILCIKTNILIAFIDWHIHLRLKFACMYNEYLLLTRSSLTWHCVEDFFSRLLSLWHYEVIYLCLIINMLLGLLTCNK